MITEFLSDVGAVATVEFKKLRRDRTELLSRAVQPVLWLVIFGQVFGKMRGISEGGNDYLTFITAGILAQSVLFSAIFYGIAVIWERDVGIVQKLLVSPAYRMALVMGKATAAGLRGLVQAIIVYLIALILGVHLTESLTAIVGVISAVVLGAALFSTFSLMIACVVKTRERFMGIGQLLTMPLFFASNAIYPLDLMPTWLRVVSRLNPLTYLVDILRQLMTSAGIGSHAIALDFAVLLLWFCFFLVIATRLYPELVK